MVDYQPSEVLAMSEFPLAWRITDGRWSRQPEESLARIKPLSPETSRRLYDRSPLAQAREPESPGLRRHRSLAESGTAQGDERVREWFRALPIEPARDVYLCWGLEGGVAAVTDWRTFVEVWSDLWYPFDRLCVFDDSRDWAVVFGPDEEVAFLESDS